MQLTNNTLPQIWEYRIVKTILILIVLTLSVSSLYAQETIKKPEKKTQTQSTTTTKPKTATPTKKNNTNSNSTSSSNSSSSSRTISDSPSETKERTIINPYISNNKSLSTRINKVTLSNTSTCVELTCRATTESG